MFSGVGYKFPRLSPLLQPEYAAARIVQNIRCGKELLLMPLAANIAPVVKGLLPPEITLELADWFGVLDSMDDFKGRAAAAANGAAAAKANGAAGWSSAGKSTSTTNQSRASRSPAKKRR